MIEIYQSHLRGEKFKGISDINLNNLPIKNPADLVGPSNIMQKLAAKHSKNLKRQEKNHR